MKAFQLRTDRSQRLDTDAGLYALDWWPGDQRSTVHSTGNFLQAISPSPAARDLLGLAVAVYCADKVALRADTPDGFTRDLELRVPVSDPERFVAAEEPLTQALRFLTGDHWTLRFRPSSGRTRKKTAGTLADAVCLFSGGLDSLTGAIDLLAQGMSLVLLGHHEGGLITHVQTDLARAITNRYGKTHVRLRQLFLTPSVPHAGQARPLPGEREDTTRSRSLLFIAAGLALADSLGNQTPLYIPENGFIGLNVPLVPARRGALSTRTTHPHFLATLGEALTALQLDADAIKNPYRLHTKGEMLAATQDTALLAEFAPRSMSCAHPTAGRWRKKPPGNCGYCWPCLIRRASMHHAGWDRSDQYAWDALTDDTLLDPGTQTGASLRAALASLSGPDDRYAVLRNGPIPDGEAPDFDALYRRGCEELRTWLRSGGGPSLRKRLPAA